MFCEGLHIKCLVLRVPIFGGDGTFERCDLWEFLKSWGHKDGEISVPPSLPFLPAILLSSPPPFLLRYEMRVSALSHSVIMMMWQLTKDPKPQRHLLLDKNFQNCESLSTFSLYKLIVSDTLSHDRNPTNPKGAHLNTNLNDNKHSLENICQQWR